MYFKVLIVVIQLNGGDDGSNDGDDDDVCVCVSLSVMSDSLQPHGL